EKSTLPATVECIGCEMLPLIVEFASKLLPSGSQNIVKHAFYLSLISLFDTIRSSEATNGSDVFIIEHTRSRHPSRLGLNHKLSCSCCRPNQVRVNSSVHPTVAWVPHLSLAA